VSDRWRFAQHACVQIRQHPLAHHAANPIRARIDVEAPHSLLKGYQALFSTDCACR